MKLAIGTFAVSVQGSGLIPSVAKRKTRSVKKNRAKGSQPETSSPGQDPEAHTGAALFPLGEKLWLLKLYAGHLKHCFPPASWLGLVGVKAGRLR